MSKFFDSNYFGLLVVLSSFAIRVVKVDYFDILCKIFGNTTLGLKVFGTFLFIYYFSAQTCLLLCTKSRKEKYVGGFPYSICAPYFNFGAKNNGRTK